MPDVALGLGLATASSLFIGASFVLKKCSLRRLHAPGRLRAAHGGHRYLRDWLWWLGLITMGVGEAFNFVAYAFAPASLVTPLGALSVIVAAALASKFLNEKLNFFGKLGCLLCILGSTVIVIHSPKQEEVASLEQLQSKLREPLFLSYLIAVAFVYFSFVFYLGPKYGSRNVLVYLFLCSAVGSLTVVFCKGIGISLRETLSGDADDFGDWTLWALVVAAALCVVVQMNYLNKSLDTFNTGVVTPVYYVMFTSCVIVASAILFKEWESVDAIDGLGNVCGFLVVVVGILLLNGFKDRDVSWKDTSFDLKPKNESPFSAVEDDNYRGLSTYGTDR